LALVELHWHGLNLTYPLLIWRHGVSFRSMALVFTVTLMILSSLFLCIQIKHTNFQNAKLI